MATQVNIFSGRQELLLLTVKRRTLSWIGHVCRNGTLVKIMLQGTADGSRRRGRPRKSWKDNRSRWAAITEDAAVGEPQRRLGVTGIM